MTYYYPLLLGILSLEFLDIPSFKKQYKTGAQAGDMFNCTYFSHAQIYVTAEESIIPTGSPFVQQCRLYAVSVLLLLFIFSLKVLKWSRLTDGNSGEESSGGWKSVRNSKGKTIYSSFPAAPFLLVPRVNQ